MATLKMPARSQPLLPAAFFPSRYIAISPVIRTLHGAPPGSWAMESHGQFQQAISLLLHPSRTFGLRWHVSLSYMVPGIICATYPLGGNRAGKWKWYRNLVIVFMVSGLWHGANWTFIVWGALHGFYIIFALS